MEKSSAGLVHPPAVCSSPKLGSERQVHWPPPSLVCVWDLGEVVVFPTGQQQVSSRLSFSLLGAMVTAGNESTGLLIIEGLFAWLLLCLLGLKFPGFLHK